MLALTANPFYELNGVRQGSTLARAAHSVHLGKPFRVGANEWYFVSTGAETGVLKVLRGVVREIGLATAALTKTHAQQRNFINSFDKL